MKKCYEFCVIKNLTIDKFPNSDFYTVNVEREKKVGKFKLPQIILDQNQMSKFNGILNDYCKKHDLLKEAIPVTISSMYLSTVIKSIASLSDDLLWVLEAIREVDILKIDDVTFRSILMNIYNVIELVKTANTTSVIFCDFECDDDEEYMDDYDEE